MSKIYITVNEQNLYTKETPTIAAEGVNENYIQFTFDPTWNDFVKTAIFYRAENESIAYTSLINNKGIALVPHEVLAREGKIYIGVSGVKGKVVQTTELLGYKIVKGRYVTETNPPSPSIYEQILLSLSGAPLAVSSISKMTNTAKTYIYQNHWYYYDFDNSAWTDGGTYGGIASEAQMKLNIDEWLDNHPEATTTVQDASLTDLKFTDDLKLKTIKDYVTPEMFGAIGDGVTDDTNALKQAIASGKALYGFDLTKQYKISDTLVINGSSKKIHINGAISYNGDGAAINIIGIYHNVYIRRINAPNGIGIKLYQHDYDLNTAYCRISFDYIAAKTGISLYPTNHGVQNCWFNLGHIIATENAIYIYGGDSTDSSKPSYTGEVVFYNGRCVGNNYAVYLDCAKGFEINKVCFNNVSFEGSTNAVMMAAGSNGKITAPVFKNIRIDEIEGTVLNINGNIRDGYFDAAVPFYANKIIANSTGDIWHPFEIRSPLYSGNGRATILGANINKKGAMFKSGGWSIPASDNVNWTPSLDAPCANRVIPSDVGITEFHLPYLAPDGTDEVYIAQTGADRIAKVYGYNNQLVFDGTSKGQGVFKVKAFHTTSGAYAIWAEL